MKPRARRVVLGAAALGAVLVAVLVVTHWPTIRDHADAWHFQLTHRTAIMIAGGRCDYGAPNQSKGERLSFALAAFSGRPVIFDPAQDDYDPMWDDYDPMPDTGGLIVPLGYRVLEQRFPRTAFVVIRGSDPSGQASSIPRSYGIIEEP